MSLAVAIDTGSPVPPFEQLRQQLLGLIVAGRLAPEQRLPPIRQLAADLAIAPGTVARAYAQLEAEGLVVTGRSRGTRVSAAAGARDDLVRAADDFLALARAGGLDPSGALALLRARCG